MIQKILISIGFVLLASFSANALEVISGTVIFVDRHHGRMEIRMEPREPHHHPFHHPAPPPPVAVVHFFPDRLPPCVREGNVIYVWGIPDPVKPHFFRAHFIRGSWEGQDPTGVRRRIERHEMRRHYDDDQHNGYNGRGGNDHCPPRHRGCRHEP